MEVIVALQPSGNSDYKDKHRNRCFVIAIVTFISMLEPSSVTVVVVVVVVVVVIAAPAAAAAVGGGPGI